MSLTLTSTLAHDLDSAVAILTDLRAHGIHIAVDDFGTGYSSLGSLNALPIDQLKIDRCFIRALETTGDTALIAGICHLAAALGMRSVAEGIEGQQQADELCALDCDAGQGYWWARPLPPDRIPTLVADHDRDLLVEPRPFVGTAKDVGGTSDGSDAVGR